MPSKSKRARMMPVKNASRPLVYWSIIGFVIKIIIIVNIQPVYVKIDGENILEINGIWAGSDAEAYLKGFTSLVSDGIFSDNGILNYWPAGYPILIFILSLVSGSWTLSLLAVVQSLLFALSAFYFALQLSKTRLIKYSTLVLLLIIFNPTLSLTSMWIGYENLVASGFLLILAIIIKDLLANENNSFLSNLIMNSVISGLIVFVQPRFILSTLAVNVFWIVFRNRSTKAMTFTLVLVFITLLFPASLVMRNNQATGLPVVSTNLGVTMNLGAGDKATGSYRSEGQGVDCDVIGLNPEEADSALVKCVLIWYFNNPVKAINLFFNKSIYFWSPWAGPEGNGTMGRNPWLKINPLVDISSTPDGANLVWGNFGKFISWLWLAGGFLLLVYGFWILWKHGGIEKIVGSSALLIIGINWLISLMTIGDHRFRIPIMGLSLLLQAIGLKTLFRGGKPAIVDSPTFR
jgi:hypothetical protein